MTNAQASRLHRDTADQIAAVPPFPERMEGEGLDTQTVLSDLARAKAAFQLRTIALVIGAPPPRLSITREPQDEG